MEFEEKRVATDKRNEKITATTEEKEVPQEKYDSIEEKNEKLRLTVEELEGEKEELEKEIDELIEEDRAAASEKSLPQLRVAIIQVLIVAVRTLTF